MANLVIWWDCVAEIFNQYLGITWGTDEINSLTQPIQDSILKEMQLDSVLGGASA